MSSSLGVRGYIESASLQSYTLKGEYSNKSTYPHKGTCLVTGHLSGIANQIASLPLKAIPNSLG